LPFNGLQTGRPFTVVREGIYIVFGAPQFSVFFDGEFLLKVALCNPFSECGLCRIRAPDSKPSNIAAQLDPNSVCNSQF